MNIPKPYTHMPY